jgi:hypothetical protein
MSTKPVEVPEGKITRDDIESKLKELRGEVSEQAEAAKMPAIAIAVGIVVLSIATAYVLGRRKGKRRQTVLEIRRL